jgi:apolipoprotein D and lipocalin family protein
MNRILILSFFVCLSFFNTQSANASGTDLVTVNYIDVGQYLGTWYRIASYPLFFEGNCSCARQVLSLGTEGKINVYNSCNEGSVNGPLREIKGYATSDDPISNSKLTVDFNFPHKGQYWIIAVDSEYRYAVVSDPTKMSLYILSKAPELSPELYQAALNDAALQMDITKLQRAEQKGCVYPQ